MPDKKQNEGFPNKETKEEHQRTEKAFEEAEHDIKNDPDFQQNENEDLDEGELARKEGHP